MKMPLLSFRVLLLFLPLIPVQAAEETPLSAAISEFKQGHLKEARALLAPALSATPDDARLLILLGRITLAEKKPKEALDLLVRASAQKECPATVHLYRGDALMVMGDAAKAEAAYRAFLEQDAKSLTVQLRLVYAQIKQNDYTAALASANKLDPLDTFNPAYFFAQAALAESRGKSDEARAAIERARTNYGNAIFASYYGDYLFLTK